MGVRNYLIEGVSCAGKTAAASELERRGYHVIHGDRLLAYQGDPETGRRIAPHEIQARSGEAAFRHAHHIWDVGLIERLVADDSHQITFFCGGARNHASFLHLFEGVFVLEIDRDTLLARLAERPIEEFGAAPAERALILDLHSTRRDMPRNAIAVDATKPLADVVDDILRSTAN